MRARLAWLRARRQHVSALLMLAGSGFFVASLYAHGTLWVFTTALVLVIAGILAGSSWGGSGRTARQVTFRLGDFATTIEGYGCEEVKNLLITELLIAGRIDSATADRILVSMRLTEAA